MCKNRQWYIDYCYRVNLFLQVLIEERRDCSTMISKLLSSDIISCYIVIFLCYVWLTCFFLLKSIIEVVSTVLIANDKAECITFPVLILVSNNMVYKDILFKQFFSLETRYYSWRKTSQLSRYITFVLAHQWTDS